MKTHDEARSMLTRVRVPAPWIAVLCSLGFGTLARAENDSFSPGVISTIQLEGGVTYTSNQTEPGAYPSRPDAPITNLIRYSGWLFQGTASQGYFIENQKAGDRRTNRWAIIGAQEYVDSLVDADPNNRVRAMIDLGPRLISDGSYGRFRWAIELGLLGRYRYSRLDLDGGRKATDREWSFTLPLLAGIGTHHALLSERVDFMWAANGFQYCSETALRFRGSEDDHILFPWGDFYLGYVQNTAILGGQKLNENVISIGLVFGLFRLFVP